VVVVGAVAWMLVVVVVLLLVVVAVVAAAAAVGLVEAVAVACIIVEFGVGYWPIRDNLVSLADLVIAGSLFG